MSSDNGNRDTTSPFEEYAEQYDRWYDGDGKLIFEIELEAFRSVLPDLPKPWLEIGVGSGRFARELGIEVGIEPSRKLVEMAQSRGIEVYRTRGEDTKCAVSSFGTIFIIFTLCFLDSPREVFKEVYRILTPAGKLTLGFIDKNSPWGKHYEKKKSQGHPFYRLARFYTCDEVKKILEQSGFSVEKVYSTLFQLPGEVKYGEIAQPYFDPEAGFTVLVALKTS